MKHLIVGALLLALFSPGHPANSEPSSLSGPEIHDRTPSHCFSGQELCVLVVGRNLGNPISTTLGSENGQILSVVSNGDQTVLEVQFSNAPTETGDHNLTIQTSDGSATTSVRVDDPSLVAEITSSALDQMELTLKLAKECMHREAEATRAAIEATPDVLEVKELVDGGVERLSAIAEAAEETVNCIADNAEQRLNAVGGSEAATAISTVNGARESTIQEIIQTFLHYARWIQGKGDKAAKSQDKDGQVCKVISIDGPKFVFLSGTATKATGQWTITKWGNEPVEWEITKATANVDLKAASGGEFKSIEPKPVKGEGLVAKAALPEGVYQLTAKCKNKIGDLGQSLIFSVLKAGADDVPFAGITGKSAICKKPVADVTEKYTVLNVGLNTYEAELKLGANVVTDSEATVTKGSAGIITIVFKVKGAFLLTVKSPSADNTLAPLTKSICVAEMKEIRGPVQVILDSAKKDPVVKGTWNLVLDPNSCLPKGLTWSVTGPGLDANKSKGTGDIANASMAKEGTFTITFKCDAAELSKDCVVIKGGGALKITGLRLAIKHVEASGPTDPTNVAAEAADLATQKAKTAPEKKWEVSNAGQSVRWFIVLLKDHEEAKKESTLPVPGQGGNVQAFGTEVPIKFAPKIPGCYLIVVFGAIVTGPVLEGVSGDFPSAVHSFVMVESDLDVVLDCDQALKSAQPHALPKLYPETVSGGADKDCLLECKPKICANTSMRFRLVSVPAFDIVVPANKNFSADSDASGFTGISTEKPSCDEATIRRDFFKLTANKQGSESFVFKVKTPTGIQVPYVQIDVTTPQARHATLNFYFIQGTGANAVSSMAGATAADRKTYLDELLAATNTYWSQVGICFAYVDKGAHAVNVPNPTTGADWGTLQTGVTTKNNVFVVPDVVDEIQIGRALINTWPNMLIMIEDPKTGCDENVQALAHEILHALANLDTDHSDTGADDLGAATGGIDNSNITGDQTTTATTEFDNP